MSQPSYALTAIGNALVDVLAPADKAFLTRQEKEHGMIPGAMSLIDESRALQLYGEMGQGVESSGGSAGNTIAGFASFGGRGAYIGKVADDPLGAVFRGDMKKQGVIYQTQPLAGGVATGRCLILVAEGGERTMNTYLGAAVMLKPEDIDAGIIAASQITYLEGYLFDPPHAKEAYRVASKTAHDAGRKVALSLSDPFCVGRHRGDFLDLVRSHVDILFANEQEIISLYEADSFEDAAAQVKGHCDVAILTRSDKGAVIVSKTDTVTVAAEKVSKVIDTTGAGDQFAAGFLYGYTQDMPLEKCGRLGALAAAEVIGHMGPRPETPYAGFLKKLAA